MLCPTKLMAQANDDQQALASAGKSKITREEFLERFEMTPWPRPPKKTAPEDLKEGFLYTVIAEKLWALKAHDMGLDTAKAIKMAFNSLEKMYVRDALWQVEIKQKTQVPDEEEAKGYLRTRFAYKTDYLISGSEKDINQKYELLKKGTSFDSILKAEGSRGMDTLTVSYGLMEEAVEDEIYSLMVGQYTSPVFTPNGWCIFRLKDIVQLRQDPKDQQKVEQLVKKITNERATARRYQQFYRSFFSHQKVNINSRIFKKLADNLVSIIKEKKYTDRISDSDLVFLQPPDLLKLKGAFSPDELKADFVEFEKDPVSLGQFIEEFAMEGFSIQNAETKEIFQIFNRLVKKYVENELLTREGYKRGLENMPEVKRSLEMWKDNYLSQLLRSQFKDSSNVTDEEALQYFHKMEEGSAPASKVKIVEVLTDSLEVAEKVLDEIKKDRDMHELARMYSKRESAAKSGGETDFFSQNEHGEIGRIASTMAVGDVYGPLKVPEGYSIFKVIAKKEDSTHVDKPFSELKDSIKKSLSTQKAYKSVVNYTVKLAGEYGLKINEKALESTQVVNIPMFTYRFMGFGGKLPAVPMTAPFTEWVDPWLEYKANLP
ncbi:MAG TPA: peptidylprolyl isomerase [Ignavibacteriales bacterium]|nr:peptidylprolyl isomerase [Ignavibacteriales bacterium]